MATRIIEYSGSGSLGNTVFPAKQFITKQPAMTATASSVASAAFNDATELVCIESDEQIYVECNSNPTADANSHRIPAGGEKQFSVRAGSAFKIAIKT